MAADSSMLLSSSPVTCPPRHAADDVTEPSGVFSPDASPDSKRRSVTSAKLDVRRRRKGCVGLRCVRACVSVCVCACVCVCVCVLGTPNISAQAWLVERLHSLSTCRIHRLCQHHYQYALRTADVDPMQCPSYFQGPKELLCWALQRKRNGKGGF